MSQYFEIGRLVVDVFAIAYGSIQNTRHTMWEKCASVIVYILPEKAIKYQNGNL